MDQEELARLMSRYDLHVIPVVDLEDRLVGIVTFDDVLDIVEEEATEDFERMAGIQPIDMKYRHGRIHPRREKTDMAYGMYSNSRL